MKTLYLDVFSGMSGDMFVGAMLDLGVDFRQLQDELKKLRLDEFHIHAARGQKASIQGTKFDVHIEDDHHHEDGDDHHAPRFTLDVGNGVEGDLAGGGRVATQFGDQRVRSFMASSGEKEHDIGNEAVDQEFGRQIRHGAKRLEVRRSICKPRGASKRWVSLNLGSDRRAIRRVAGLQRR